LIRDFHGSGGVGGLDHEVSVIALSFRRLFFSLFVFYSHIHRRLIFVFLRSLLPISRYWYIINIVYWQYPDVARPWSDGISLSSGLDAGEVYNMKCNDCERRSRRWRRRSVTKRKRSDSRATTIGRRQSRHTGKILIVVVFG